MGPQRLALGAATRRRRKVNWISAVVSTAATIFALAALPATAWAKPVECNDSSLDKVEQGQDVDLVVSEGTCTVPEGTYKFHNIWIYSLSSRPSVLRFKDEIIDLYAESILVQKGGILAAGSLLPFHPIGLDGGRLTIHLWGKSTDPSITCAVDDHCQIPDKVWDSSKTLVTPPKKCNDVSLPALVRDCFYPYDIFADSDKSNGRKAYFGYKVLALSYGGAILLYGKKGVAYCGDKDCGRNNLIPPFSEPAHSGSARSWARLTSDMNVDKNGQLKVGSQQLTIDRFVDWSKDDHIVLTTTDYLPGHSEELIIQGVPVYNTKEHTTTIKFLNADKDPQDSENIGTHWPHNAKKYDYSELVPDRLHLKNKSAETRAAVALLSRSIRIVSDGDTPQAKFEATAGNYFGGHTIVRQGFAAYQVQGVEFAQLGQGGLVGHYPVHMHMVRNTPRFTWVKDSSINESMTRWITLHGTQGVTLARNVGYKSIGHGFYIEDGTETDNKLYTNIGVFARAAVDNDQNPRQVPGLLTPKTPADPYGNPDAFGFNQFPYYSDSDHPSVFWIMNGWNDFEYNMAAGAGTCGACYWYVPGAISGPSQYQAWYGYAGEQEGQGRAGITPLKKFLGNSCSSAMNAFTVNTTTADCNGVNQRKVSSDKTKPLLMLPSEQATNNYLPKKNPPDKTYWPIVSGGGRYATRCPDADAGKALADCSKVPICANGVDANCDVTVLDEFTTAFNWAQQNYAAIWIRPQWGLVVDSVVSDVQNGGINFVTSGGYSKADVITGFWALRRSLLGAQLGITRADAVGDLPGGPPPPGCRPVHARDRLTAGAEVPASPRH
ncbi:MAG TPA: hypothetical protein VGX03_16825 [Candidatus Binatia bacterium]|nr:hypothetical protein [Candidatus Binatia bacterium]